MFSSIRSRFYLFGLLLIAIFLFFFIGLILDHRVNSFSRIEKINTEMVSQSLRKEWDSKVRSITVILADSMVEAMASEDYHGMYAMIEKVMGEDRFDFIYAQDVFGMIQAESSPGAEKVGTMMNDQFFQQAKDSQKMVVHKDEDHHNVEVVAPVLIESDCVGVIRIGYSLDQIETATKEIRQRLRDNMNGIMKEISMKLLMAGICMIVLLVVLSRLMVRSIVLPIRKLMEGVTLARKGNLGYRIPENRGTLDAEPTGNNELAILTRAFNEMLSQLEDQRKNLLRSYSQLDHLKSYLDNIYNSMPSVLIGVDPDGSVTQWNLEAEKKTGIPAAEARNKKIVELLPRLSDELAHFREAIATRSAHHSPKIIHRIDNRLQYEDMTIYPLIANGIDGAVIRIDDVTERVQLEEMMVQTEKMMSVGGLAAGMAHEINNPLAAILQNFQLLELFLMKRTPKNEAIAVECRLDLASLHAFMEKRNIPKIISSVNEAGLRAKKIVANMLSFSRKASHGKNPCDMVQLLEQTIQLAFNDYDLKKRFDFKKVVIVREYEQKLSPAFCEASQIQQVLFNLLKNGAQAMAEDRESGKTPELRLRISSDKDIVRVEVEDNGPGMDEETVSHVFDPFFTTKGPGQGTGLGLSVSYYIVVDNHGGTLSVQSAAGKGTTFIVELPTAGSSRLQENNQL